MIDAFTTGFKLWFGAMAAEVFMTLVVIGLLTLGVILHDLLAERRRNGR